MAEHVDAVDRGMELDGAADDDAGMQQRSEHERATRHPDDQVDDRRHHEMDDDAELNVVLVHPDNDRMLLEPEWPGTLNVFLVAPEDPAHPGPALGLERVVRIARLIGETVVLGVIVHPVAYTALHREEQVEHGDDLRRRGELPGAVLQDTVQRADAHVAPEDREGDNADGERHVPPVEGELADKDAEQDHRHEQRHTENGIGKGGEEAWNIEGFPRFRDRDGARCHLQVGPLPSARLGGGFPLRVSLTLHASIPD